MYPAARSARPAQAMATLSFTQAANMPPQGPSVRRSSHWRSARSACCNSGAPPPSGLSQQRQLEQRQLLLAARLPPLAGPPALMVLRRLRPGAHCTGCKPRRASRLSSSRARLQRPKWEEAAWSAARTLLVSWDRPSQASREPPVVHGAALLAGDCFAHTVPAVILFMLLPTLAVQPPAPSRWGVTVPGVQPSQRGRRSRGLMGSSWPSACAGCASSGARAWRPPSGLLFMPRGGARGHRPPQLQQALAAHCVLQRRSHASSPHSQPSSTSSRGHLCGRVAAVGCARQG